jgi:GntR family transcriptional regulator, transcriptional repressor for pyruvate dehydrogenase complex
MAHMERVHPADSLKRTADPRPVYQRVVQQIQETIKAGELLPGDQLLPERELAEKFGVSRTSMRKALAVLAGMGVIEVSPRDGAYVRRRSLNDTLEPLTQVLYRERSNVLHLFEVRQIIETQAVRLAALRCTEADVQFLRELNRQFEADLRRGYVAGQSNTAFHLAIVEAAKNPPLTEIMTALLTATMEIYALPRQRSLLNHANLLQFVDEHERIIGAMARQDPDLAAQLMAKHIDDARRRVEVEEESR